MVVVAVAPMARSRVPSGVHATWPSVAHSSFDSGRSAPLSTSTPVGIHDEVDSRSGTAIVLPSGDHDGPPKNAAVSDCGAFLASSTRSPLPSALATRSALSTGVGKWLRPYAIRLPSGEKATAVSTPPLTRSFGCPPMVGIS